MKTICRFRILAPIAALLFIAACAELKNDLPVTTGAAGKVHPPGWSDTASVNFHGHFIQNANWDMTQCKTCHGANYRGGTVNVSCYTCHAEAAGPENCSNCHGSTNPAPPKDTHRNWRRSAPAVGAHQVHVVGGAVAGAVIAGPTLCSECHTVPGSVSSPGHIDSARASVHFSLALARTATNEVTSPSYSPTLPTITPSPVYDTSAHSCSSTYCHGDFKNGNPGHTLVWNDTTGTQAACGTCHGDPTRATLLERALPKTAADGGTHPNNTNCALCHDQVVNAAGKIVDPSKHVNGLLNIGTYERDF